MKKFFLCAIVLTMAGSMVFTACSGKKENSGSSASGSGSSQSASQNNGGTSSNTVMKVTAEAKARLETYGLTAEKLKPTNTIYADTVENPNYRGELVGFLYSVDAEPNRKENFTRICEAFIAAADDGKIWLYMSGQKKEIEFEIPLFVDDGALMHQFAWVYNGNIYCISLYQANSNVGRYYLPNDNTSYPAYIISFQKI
jgi:hypothetical protein